MVKASDYWIRKSSEFGDGIQLRTTRLSTFEEKVFLLDKEDRKVLGKQWKSVHSSFTSIESLEDSIVSLIPSKIPKLVEYIGNLKQDIIPDRHEPDKMSDMLGIRKVDLYTSDYFWKTQHNKIVMIERKCLYNGELVNCLFKPRGNFKGITETVLTSQARKMSEHADIKVLFIELGPFGIDYSTGKIKLPMSKRIDKQGKVIQSKTWPYKWSAIQKKLISLCDTWNLKLWFAYDKSTAPYDIMDMREYFNRKEYSGSLSVPNPVIISSTEDVPPELQMISVLPGVGPVIARRILTHFGSLREAITADEDEWMKAIDGVGKDKAVEIIKTFTRIYK